MRLLSGGRRKPVKEIKKGEPGIYWNSIGGQYYAYDGKSNYVIPMVPDEKMPITSIKFSDSYFNRIYKLTPKEGVMHIKNLKRGISSIRAQIGWLEKHLSLVSGKRTKNR